MVATTATRPATARVAGIGLWTLQVALAVTYAFSAYGKLSADPLAVAGFELMGLGTTGMYIIGVLELAGAIAMFVPRLTGPAAACFVALMIGAAGFTLALGMVSMVAFPVAVGLVAAVVAWGRRDSTRRLIAQLRR